VAVSEVASVGQASRREEPLRGRLLVATRGALLVLGVAAGVALIVIPASRVPLAGHPADFVLVIALGWSFIGCGLIVWQRWPIAGPGALMVGVGFVWFAARLALVSGWSPLFTGGMWLSDLWPALFTVFIVSFPRATPKSRGGWLLAAPFLFVLVPLEFVWLLFFDPGSGSPANELLVWDKPAVASALDLTQRVILLAASLVLAAALARRWLTATAARRVSLTPVLVGACAVLLSSSLAVQARYGATPHWLQLVVLAAWALVPAAVLVDVLRARLARSAVSDLVVELSANPAPAVLRDALARALGDPKLRLAFWLPEFRTYAGPDGLRIDLEPAPDQEITVVERGRRPVAALVHDAALRSQPELLDGVVAAAGIALENARLQSELRAQMAELRASRARLVEAGDSARRRLERNLHDGAQQRLVALSVALGLAESKIANNPEAAAALLCSARADLAVGLEELREIARGLHPAILSRGLEVALEGLVDRSPVPVELKVELDGRSSEQVEAAAYYVVAEALTNVARYADAAAAQVTVHAEPESLRVQVVDDGVGGAIVAPGSGLQGLRDRVEAIGGHLDLQSPVGGGTRLTSYLPWTERDPE
jgi:signal transduction histidine kinase